MARYRKIDVRVWVDEKFRRLTPLAPCGQALWLYLLTNPDTTSIPGLFRAGQAAMAEALGWPLEAFREAFREVFAEGMAKADWQARVVWIPNACKYASPESPNVVKSWRAAWDEIPECALKLEAYHALKAFTEGLGKAFAEAFAQALAKPSAKALPNQEQEQEQEQEIYSRRVFAPQNANGAARARLDDPPPLQLDGAPPKPANGSRYAPQVRDVFEHWRATLSPRAVLDNARRAKVEARLRDGYTVEQLKRAIDGCARSPWHMGDNPQRRKHTDLSLICRDAKHVDDFLAIAERPDRRPGEW